MSLRGGLNSRPFPYHGNALPLSYSGKSLIIYVGREGFEPPKASPADLQSAPFDHSGTDPKLKRSPIVAQTK